MNFFYTKLRVDFTNFKKEFLTAIYLTKNTWLIGVNVVKYVGSVALLPDLASDINTFCKQTFLSSGCPKTDITIENQHLFFTST